jgi:hypothetical protein
LKDQFNKLEGFFRNTLKIETFSAEGKAGEVGFQGEGGSGFTFPFLKFKAEFHTKMRADRESRETVRTEYRPRMSELVHIVKNLLTDIKSKIKGKKELLILVDGLDRVAVKPAEKLFAEDGQHIALIDNVHMLLTVPISLIHSVKSAVVESTVGKMHVLKNLRLITSTKTTTAETEKNRATMKDVVLKRMEEHLISLEALELAITYSGGVFRTLIDLIATAALEAVVSEGKTIGEKDMLNAVKEFRIKRSRPLGRSHWEILLQIDKNKKFSGDMDERRLELLQGLYILEYINDEVWYRVNPIIESLLEEWKQIVDTNPR